MNIKNIARAYQICFDYHGGEFHGDGLTVAGHLSGLCKRGTTYTMEAKGTDGTIDHTALLIALGRRQVYDEIHSMLTMETTE